MSLRDGSETIVEQCLDISRGEKTVVLNDNNDQKLIDSLLKVLEDKELEHKYLEYPEPDTSGTEPPAEIAEAMRDADVFIAPTLKSISHTDARRTAVKEGARGATLPGINEEIWGTSLQADYNRVKEISEKAYELIRETEEIRVETPSGTDLTIKVEPELFHKDTGIVHSSGGFSNLPAGEAHGGVRQISGTLVIDHLPMVSEEDHGAEVEIKKGKVVAVENAPEGSELLEAFENVEGSRNIAEFGFGTNPEADLIGNTLNDEKVLGTVHIAFGDEGTYISDGVSSDIHWDNVCIEPTVWFDDRKVIDEGEPTEWL